MVLFALQHAIWGGEKLLYDSVEPPSPSLSPYFFILDKNASLTHILETNHHLYLEIAPLHTLEASMGRLLAAKPDFALCMTTRNAYYSGMAHEISQLLSRRFGLLNHKSALIKTCLQEAIINSIVHGNLGIRSDFSDQASMEKFYEKVKACLNEPGYRYKRVTVSASQYKDHVTIGVMDEGSGFSSDEKEVSPNMLHGRGLMLIRSMADKVWADKESKTVFMTFKY